MTQLTLMLALIPKYYIVGTHEREFNALRKVERMENVLSIKASPLHTSIYRLAFVNDNDITGNMGSKFMIAIHDFF